MSTNITRYLNTADFRIHRGIVDLTDEEINIKDYFTPRADCVYYIDKDNNFSFKEINKGGYREAILNHYNYTIIDGELEKLLATGKCTAYAHYNTRKAEVYVGLNVVPRLKELGNESIAMCYNAIAKIRKENEAKQKEKELLLGVGAKVQETNTDFSSFKSNEIDSILTSIEVANFLQGCRLSDNDFFHLRQKEIEDARKKLFTLIK